MHRIVILLIAFLLLNAVGCSSIEPIHFKGISTTSADYPTKPDPLPAEADWAVQEDSSYAEVIIGSEPRTHFDLPKGEPVRFFRDRGQWKSKEIDGWTVSAIQRGDSLFIYRSVGDGGVAYKLQQEKDVIMP